MKKLVLIGGGHSHAIALKHFAQNPLKDVRIVLISDVEQTPYSGMLSGYVAGFYSYEECHIDLNSLTQYAKAEMICDRAIGLDLNNNQVLCENQPPVRFDLLSIDIGSTPATLSVPGAAEHAIPVKPVPHFLQQWNQIIEQVTNNPDSPIRIGIVGGGAGGVELALNLHSRLSRILKSPQLWDRPKINSESQPKINSEQSNLEIHLFHRDAELMTNHNPWVRQHMGRLLTRRGIIVHLQEKVCEVKPQLVRCESGLNVKFNYLFWVTQASAPDWPKISGLAVDSDGFILVSDTLRSLSHPQVFAAGDIATIVNHPCPKAGVFAVRQGKPLFNNLWRTLQSQPLKPYKPQKRYLSLIGTGDGSAVASWGSWGWESPLLWSLKDWIDRRFMDSFS
ncbi:pyridine nucleotide-disulfide oxidoreductase family protein [Microseira wollei NIES-4236]|uniref:Pyridine nucleotide-disulfide oxidoreductase family protein n=2 Tax=Microseira wollei TaxID=467598 RepID=A0AAV3XEC9_9CYAN|nr:pyridine nucleotide-disulfide oxidoreductase family protein [Microseira wollei NIES-4236]